MSAGFGAMRVALDEEKPGRPTRAVLIVRDGGTVKPLDECCATSSVPDFKSHPAIPIQTSTRAVSNNTQSLDLPPGTHKLTYIFTLH